jgi:hypothetical protein
MNYKRLRVWQEAHYLAVEMRRAVTLPEDDPIDICVELCNDSMVVVGKIARAAGLADRESRLKALSTASRKCTQIMVKLEIAKGLDRIDEEAAERLESQAERVRMLLRRVLQKSIAGRRA